MTEVLNSKRRGRYMTYVASNWMFGSIAAAAVGWPVLRGRASLHFAGLSGWRLYFLICILPAVFTCVLASALLVESPCFLIKKRKFAAAAASLTRIAATSGGAKGGAQRSRGKGPGEREVSESDRLYSGKVSPHSRGSTLEELLWQLRRSEAHEAERVAEWVAEGARGGQGARARARARAEGTFAEGLRASVREIRAMLRHGEARRTMLVIGVVWFCLSACWYGFMIWLPEFMEAKVSSFPHALLLLSLALTCVCVCFGD